VTEIRGLAVHRSGEVARRTGVSADTLAHYEARGVLRKPRRLPNGYRAYPEDAVERVLLVQRALAVGFTLEELARLLRARDAGRSPCREVRALTETKLRDVERRLRDLRRFREALVRILEAWDARLAEAGDKPARLLESLGRAESIGSPRNRNRGLSPKTKRKGLK
jgi:MerR family transcriptional regulator, mercuric resistance operon regulatory protein